MPTLTSTNKLPYPDPSHSVDVARDLKALAEAIDGLVTGGLPVGSIVNLKTGATPPAGWVPCDGRAHGSPVLQALLGSANVPNLTGLMLIGAGTAALHTTGGKATADLTSAHLPSHSHTTPTSTGAGAMATHTHTLTTAAANTGNATTPTTHAHKPSQGAHFMESNHSNPDKADVSAKNQPYIKPSSIGAAKTSTAVGGDHTHTGTIGFPALGSHSSAHTHNVTFAAAGKAGVSRPNIPANIALNYIIRAV